MNIELIEPDTDEFGELTPEQWATLRLLVSLALARAHGQQVRQPTYIAELRALKRKLSAG